MKASVFLTRPEGKNQTLAALLHNAGIASVTVPALEVQPIQDPAFPVPVPDDYQLLVFVSSQAANFYMQAIKADVTGFSWPISTYVATVGWASAQPLYEAGIIPAASIIHPDANLLEHDSEALWPMLQKILPAVQRALIIRGEQGREWLGSRLEAEGIAVTRHAMYARRPVVWDTAQRLAVQLAFQQAKLPPVFLLTSSESVDAVLKNIEQLGLLALFARARFVVLHSRIAQHLSQGLKAAGQPSPSMVKICSATDAAIAQALQDSALPDPSS